jgi:hypothetical protein
MRIIRTTGQHSALGEFFCYQLPWFRLSILAFAGLVGVTSFAFPETIFASGADSNPAIRIRVNNYTQASPAILAGAEREAGRILGQAGLQTVWLDCPPGIPPLTRNIPVASRSKLPTSRCAYSLSPPSISSKTLPLVLQLSRFWPASTTTMWRISQGVTTPSSRSPSFWVVS